MQLTFWGVRGTVPQSGPEYQYYGGHTSCTSLRVGKDLIVFDAGSGLVNLSQYLEQETDRPQAIYFFITHGHLDHIIGLIGFSWLWKSRCPFEIHFISASAHAGHGIESILQTLMAPPYFPLSLKESKAPIFYHDLKDIPNGFQNMDSKISPKRPECTEGYMRTRSDEIFEKQILKGEGYGWRGDGWRGDGWSITAFPLQHPGGSSGYRFHGPDHSLAFVTDTAPIESQSFYDWLNGVDLLIHDAMFNDEQSDLYPDWGHSSVKQVADLANKVAAKNLILYHHHHYHTDADIKKLEHQAQSIFPRSSMARQGDILDIPFL